MIRLAEIGIAAFLHDIGKALQRAEQPLSNPAWRMADQLCPVGPGGPTHQHVLWTNEVLDQRAAWLPPELDRSRIAELASFHHRPATVEQWMIAEADRIASGHDRRPRTEEEAPDFRTVPLVSVFSKLALRDRVPPQRCLPPSRLTGEAVLRTCPANDAEAVRQGYLGVASQVLDRLSKWPVIAMPRVAEALLALSSAYLTRVPASTVDEPDVSLHDHSALVAAFATVLYRYHDLTHTETEAAVRDRSKPKVRVLTGDLSGIQKYLLAPPAARARGIARAFRARSFYLSLLTHAASLRVLGASGLTVFARVLDAGGRFVILVPDAPQITGALQRVATDIDSWMIRAHAGRLTLALDWSTTAAGRDFMAAGFRSLYPCVQYAADLAKRRRLEAYLRPSGAWQPEDQVLGYLHDEQRRQREHERDSELGRQLPYTRFVGLWPPGCDAAPGLLSQPLDILGLQTQLFRELPDHRSVSAAADFFALELDDAEQLALGWRPLAAYVPRLTEDDVAALRELPTDDDDPPVANQIATFSQIAHLGCRSGADGTPSGLKAIACLKADVDRLGLLFTRGFGDRTSFGRIACLSRELDGFLKSYLRDALARPDSPHRLTYTVFAGGDDLMLIGPWRGIFRLAAELHDWFTRLTGNNPDVTLSAGIALGHERLPVHELAAAADEELERAKEAGRDRVAVFGEAHLWRDYQAGLQNGQWLDELLRRNDFPITPAFVYRLLRYSRSALRLETARSASATGAAVAIADLRTEWTWRSQFHYDFRRNIRDRLRQNAPASDRADTDRLEQLVAVEMRANPDAARRLRLAAMFALYANRGG